MIGWLLALPQATWRQRFWALLLLVLVWLNVANTWNGLHAGLVIAHWIAWFTIGGAVFVTPMCLFILLGNRAPRWFGAHSGLVTKTLPQIHAEIRRGHGGRGQGSRRF